MCLGLFFQERSRTKRRMRAPLGFSSASGAWSWPPTSTKADSIRARERRDRRRNVFGRSARWVVEVLRCGSGFDLCAFTTNNTDKQNAVCLSVIFKIGSTIFFIVENALLLYICDMHF